MDMRLSSSYVFQTLDLLAKGLIDPSDPEGALRTLWRVRTSDDLGFRFGPRSAEEMAELMSSLLNLGLQAVERRLQGSINQRRDPRDQLPRGAYRDSGGSGGGGGNSGDRPQGPEGPGGEGLAEVLTHPILFCVGEQDLDVIIANALRGDDEA
jgi:hypothetical protein